MISENLKLMAQAWKDGIDSRPALHDLLIEHGYDHAAKFCFGSKGTCHPGVKCCSSIISILQDNEHHLKNWNEALKKFQENENAKLST